MQLNGIVRLGRRDVGLIELDRRARESSIGIAALALQALVRTKGGENHLGIVVRLELGLYVRLLLLVRDADRIGGRFGSLESVRHSERDILAVVANDVVFERWAPFFADTFHSWL